MNLYIFIFTYFSSIFSLRKKISWQYKDYSRKLEMPNHIKKKFMTLGIVKNSHNAQTAHIYNYRVHVYQLDFIVFHLWINQI